MGITWDGTIVLAPTKGPLMVVASPTPDVMVTVLVVGGGMTVVMKCAEHSSAPAGFQYMAVLTVNIYNISCEALGHVAGVSLAYLRSSCLRHRHHPRPGTP